MRRKKLKNLEACILGIISAKRPCTPYQVVKSFANSPSLFYSSGEGSVYPAIKRLEKEGLITGKQVGTKARPAKGYHPTKEGRKIYKTWYFDQGLIADGGFDPIRLRFSVLDSLTPEGRKPVLKIMIKAVSKRLRENESMIRNLPERSTPYMAGVLERAVLKAKQDLLKKWQKDGVSFRSITGDFDLIEKGKVKTE